jgi:hypothetical protein
MLMALIGAVVAVVVLPRIHDRSMAAVTDPGLPVKRA